jgi:hypothetical protein
MLKTADKVQQYRARAEQCRARADLSRNETAEAVFLNLAQQ